MGVFFLMKRKIKRMDIVNVKELSKLISIPESTIYKYTANCQIPFIKMGNRIRFEMADIEKWLEEHKVLPKTHVIKNTDASLPFAGSSQPALKERPKTLPNVSTNPNIRRKI